MVQLLKVIKFEGDDKTLVWKHPDEDFNTHSKLIVHESQVAILYENGRALDEFGPGKYLLENENIPLLRGITNIPTEGVSPFHCEVYFINKAISLNIVWGTSSRFPIIDPEFKIPINVGASGVMDIVVDDARKFLINVVGTQGIVNAATLNNYFKGKITIKVKNYLSKIMSELSYYNITQHLEEISEALHKKLKEDFSEYGVNLVTFYLTNVIVPKEDTQKLENILNKEMEYGRLGFNWADEQMSDIAKKYAANPGGQNDVGGAVAGIPLALALGQMLNDNIAENLNGSLFSNSKNFGNKSSINSDAENSFCSKCGNKLADDAMFCSKCGTKVVKEIQCKNCGAELKEEDVFCSKCGTKIEK